MVLLLHFMTVSYNLLNVFCTFHFRDNTFMRHVFMTSHNIVPLYFLPNKQNPFIFASG